MKSLLLIVVAFVAGLANAADTTESSGKSAESKERLLPAISLLERQPRTQENIDRAQEILLQIAKESASPAALYLGARIAEVHSQPPDVALAIQRYEELFGAVPEHPLAQAGVVKMLRLKIYQNGRDPGAALNDAAGWETRLTDPDARRDFHLLMGRSLLFFYQNRVRARDHLEAALKIGLQDSINRANTLVAVAELYFEEGKGNLARPYYEKFLSEFSRDQRRQIVKERLAAIGGQPQ